MLAGVMCYAGALEFRSLLPLSRGVTLGTTLFPGLQHGDRSAHSGQGGHKGT